MQRKILVVDSNQATCVLLETILRAQNYEVVTAQDGERGLEHIQRHNPDLVLLEVSTPRINGFNFCRRIKSNVRTRLVPVVLISGLTSRDDRLCGIKSGADGFLRKPIDGSELLATVRSLVNLKAYTDEFERAETVMFALARSIEGKDPYTEGHCERLSEYSARLGGRLGLSAQEIVALRWASVVHDVGKVAVPDSILLKPGPLTLEEKTIMQQHPVVGERICEPLRTFRLVLPIIRHHHEKMDGSGYPDGLQGDQIPLTARVLQVVDIYDALTTERPYKRAYSSDEALKIMEGEVMRGWWDPVVLAEFRQMLEASGIKEKVPASMG